MIFKRRFVQVLTPLLVASVLVLLIWTIFFNEDTLNSWPWFVTRAAAITAYFLLFLMIAMGELMAEGTLYEYMEPPRAWLIHKYLGISFGLALLTHLVALLFDNFLPFGLADIFIPFHATYRPLAVALGIVGFYLIVMLLTSSLISNLQHRSWWRRLHFLAYPVLVFGLFHGLLSGSDSGNIFMLLLYITTGMIFCVLLVRRFLLARSRR